MQGTFWALLPPIVAIVLSLITKEVYISLFSGIIVGALLFTNFNILETIDIIFTVMTESIYGGGTNIRIVLFLIILGTIVVLVTKSGASVAYGKWASKKIKNKKTALLSTFFFASMLFIDDYFSCLTTGHVMRPITDKNKVSRAKLAYVVDSTAVPMCILIPLSSWTAAISSSLTESGAQDGFSFFIRTIPYNIYAILTIIMVITVSLFNIDFSSMLKHETNAMNGDLTYSGIEEFSEEVHIENKRGKVFDLIAPILSLIICCVLGLLYTGGILNGNVSILEAFSHCNSSKGLLMGSFVSLIITSIIYVPRKVISFKDFVGSIAEGFKEMSSAIIVLAMAWTLGNITQDYLKAGIFISSIVKNHAASSAFIPVIIFILAAILSFSTGTSWGTFAMFIPIAYPLFPPDNELLVITIAAVLAGSVFGDHVSPISDTTIMAATGTKCSVINHISNKLPYALLIACISASGFILAGFIQNPFIVLAISIALLYLTLFAIKVFRKSFSKTDRGGHSPD